MCILGLSSQFHSDEDTVCVYSRTQVLVRRTRFVCILELSSSVS